MNTTLNNRKLTILVGEDEDYNYMLLRENFKLFFHEATLIRASDGEEVVSIALSNDSIDLILMDIRMPLMNGYQATVLIKQSKPLLPIIAQTAYALADDRARALLSGCDDYIPKPYEYDELFEKVNKCIERYSKVRYS
jgi:CheY-like chemotaxis protein